MTRVAEGPNEWGNFSVHNHSFRPGRSAHQAVTAAQSHLKAGHRTVVDVDLEKFFGRVNHDILMDRLAQRTADKRVLCLIRRWWHNSAHALNRLLTIDHFDRLGVPRLS